MLLPPLPLLAWGSGVALGVAPAVPGALAALSATLAGPGGGGGALVQHAQGVVVQLERGAHGGLAQQVALAVRQLQVAQQAQVGRVLDALGNQLRAKHLRQPLQRLQRLQLVGVARQVVAEIRADLDVKRAQFRPQAQAGAPVAKIVQRQLYARAAQLLAHAQQLGKVAHALFFGDFQHQLLRVDAVQPHLVHHVVYAVLLAGVYQRIGPDVDEQPPALAGLAPLLERLAQAEQVELARQPLARGQAEQQLRAQVDRILGATDQRLVRPHRALAQVANGLEHVAQSVVAHQAFEHAFVEHAAQRGGVLAGQVGGLDRVAFLHDGAAGVKGAIYGATVTGVLQPRDHGH